MSPYMLDEASKHLLSDCPPIYDLYGIVYHFGNSYVGHYTAAARPPSDKERQQAGDYNHCIGVLVLYNYTGRVGCHVMEHLSTLVCIPCMLNRANHIAEGNYVIKLLVHSKHADTFASI